ncbi:MAG: 5-deoxy-glucuronate isomerase, partial [Anaerolineae bacterium]
MEHFYKSRPGTGVVVEVTPETAGWQYLAFRVVRLFAGETYREETAGTEVALVPLQGIGMVEVSGERFPLSRENVFKGASNVLYVPPRKSILVTATTDFEFSTGSAPAEGRYPTRLFTPEEMKQELRGGGAARRQVNHVLAHPLPAERLILYEVYVPGGMWSGWPPHHHDGANGSPYLEETYYYRFEPQDGFGLQRNYDDATGFDELFTVKHGDLALVARGYHPVTCAPGTNMYFLNYQAGNLIGEARGTPPRDDP